MAGKKTLVLGSMPAGAAPAEYLAAGPWCFAGREKLFPDWERCFTFAPEPFAGNPGLLARAARAAEYLCVSSIPAIAPALAENSANLPPVYWQTLLCPWLIDVAKQIVERSLRCRAMIRKWGNEALTVPLLSPQRQFNFATEHAFTLRGALGIYFNHWLFSLLLEKDWPAAWEKASAPDVENATTDMPDDAGFIGRLFRLARNSHLNLPFPRLKGMGIARAMRYSMALMHPCHQKDHSINLDDFGREWPTDIPLDRNGTQAIFMACLPSSLKKLRHPANVGIAAKPRLRVASVLSYEDAAYRQRLALWRARGNRLAYVQHGGNYGQVKVACDTELVEYSQDVFFTWGWKRHGQSRGNFIPMTYPQLAAMANNWQMKEPGNLLFVGTEMAAFPYRLDSRPTPLQFLAYRAAKAIFFDELGADLQAKSLYRPYFDLPGTLEDAAWLLPKFPLINLCQGPLAPHMLGCRLLILDHHGTTMLEALVANTPMILYWNPSHWALAPESEKLLDMLADAGIWFDSPQQAARKAREVWEAAPEWWQTDAIQGARRAWLQNQALCDPENMDGQWIHTLKKL